MSLRNFTAARVELGRTGDSLPTREFLKLQAAHAAAREAVHSSLDVRSLALELPGQSIFVKSAAADRAQYLRQPDLGRRLNENSRESLKPGSFDAVFVIGDGLSARAVQLHAAPLVQAVLRLAASDWKLAPFVIAEQARVAIGDEIGARLGAKLSVVLIGERPGLSSADSLGVYLTWDPQVGRTDAERNCISNIRQEGLTYPVAANKLVFLMNESRRRKLSGVNLKESAPALL